MFGDVPVPNQTCQRLANYLYIYALVFTIFSCAKCVVLGPSQIFSDLISVLLLCLGAYQFSHILVSFFVLFTAFQMFTYIAMVGLAVQRGESLTNKKHLVPFLVALGAVLSYAVGWALCLYGYREFKAVSEGLPPKEGWANPEFSRLGRDEETLGLRDSDDQKFEAFQGQGVAIGQSK